MEGVLLGAEIQPTWFCELFTEDDLRYINKRTYVRYKVITENRGKEHRAAGVNIVLTPERSPYPNSVTSPRGGVIRLNPTSTSGNAKRRNIKSSYASNIQEVNIV